MKNGCLGCFIIFILLGMLGGIIQGIYYLSLTEQEKAERVAREEQKNLAAEQEKRKEKNKEQKYNKVYGKPMHAQSLYDFFENNGIEASKACNKSPVQIEGIILGMGTNSYGNFIDLHTSGVFKTEAADIRVFLAEGEWNNNAIAKIKKRNTIVAGGLCYGRTEVYGIKTKIVIGNATILKVGGEFL